MSAITAALWAHPFAGLAIIALFAVVAAYVNYRAFVAGVRTGLRQNIEIIIENEGEDDRNGDE